MPEPLRFVHRDVVRCEDCDIRGDLHDTGYPLRDAGGRIASCSTCGGHASVKADSPRDPYDGVDEADPYVRIRKARAEAARLAVAPRPVRRRYLESVRIESLMSEEPTRV